MAASLLVELERLGRPAQRYVIVDISSALRARQQQRLAAWPQVQWASALPQALRGVVIGNEVLDAMPVKLLARLGGVVPDEAGLQLPDQEILQFEAHKNCSDLDLNIPVLKARRQRHASPGWARANGAGARLGARQQAHF